MLYGDGMLQTSFIITQSNCLTLDQCAATATVDTVLDTSRYKHSLLVKLIELYLLYDKTRSPADAVGQKSHLKRLAIGE